MQVPRLIHHHGACYAEQNKDGKLYVGGGAKDEPRAFPVR